MTYEYKTFIVTFVLDSNGQVIQILFPFSIEGGENLALTYNYGVSVALAQAVVQTVINSLPT